MKHLMVIFVLLMLIIPSITVSQSADREEINLMKYQMERKNPGTAVLLSLLISGAGQYYNEQHVKGTIFLLTEIISTALIINELFKEKEEYIYYDPYEPFGYPIKMTEDRTNMKILTVSGIILLTDAIFSSIDAYNSAKNINKSLKKKYNINMSFEKNNSFVNLVYNF